VLGEERLDRLAGEDGRVDRRPVLADLDGEHVVEPALRRYLADRAAVEDDDILGGELALGVKRAAHGVGQFADRAGAEVVAGAAEGGNDQDQE